MPETSSYIKHLTYIACALFFIYCFISNSLNGIQAPLELFHLTAIPKTAVEISSRSPSPNKMNTSVKDFYKFYSRDIEASAWGSELPIHSRVPKSGLGIFVILWTESDENGQQKIKDACNHWMCTSTIALITRSLFCMKIYRKRSLTPFGHGHVQELNLLGIL